MSFTAVGDALIERHLPQGGYSGFKQIKDILNKGDTRFFNLETTLHNFESFASEYSGGGWLCSPPSVLNDLKAFGFNITAWANNHTMDYSYGGLKKTLQNVHQAGIPLAGAGKNLQEASQPAYFDSKSGRVAVVAGTSTFNSPQLNEPAAIAGNASIYLKGRPGLNPLRHKDVYYVTKEDAKKLKQIANYTHIDDDAQFYRDTGFAPQNTKGVITFGSQITFKESSIPGHKSFADHRDLLRFKKNIEEARAEADYVIVSIHCHEMKTKDRESIPDFLKEFAHKCINFGADAIVGHGPHTLRAIEIYQHKPIFYSLGDFIVHIENFKKGPADWFENYGLPTNSTMHDLWKTVWANYTRGVQVNPKLFETVIPHWQTKDGKLTKLTLTPVELGFKYKISDGRRGWPTKASDSKILDRLAKLSKPFNTQFKIKNNQAEIKL